MSTMYSRSVVMLEQSREALKRVSEDEAFLDAACFEAQQAIEFLIKAILLENGVPYNKSHDIRYLYELLKETGFTFEKDSVFGYLSQEETFTGEGTVFEENSIKNTNTHQEQAHYIII